jgi:spoIIIJ-associated protein
MSTDFTSPVSPTLSPSVPAPAEDAADTATSNGIADADVEDAGCVSTDSDSGHTRDSGADDSGPDDSDTDDSDTDDDGGATGTGGNSLLVREGDVAADYLETLLDIVDYDGDIDLDVENGRAIVAVVGSDLSPLVGPNGATLDALQELTRLAVQQQTGVRSRLMLDVSGHRNQRRQQLTDLATTTAKSVVESGQPVRLSPMNPFERKVVHDAISGLSGVESESEGDEPQRRVVVHPVG